MDPVKYRRRLSKLGTADKLWSDYKEVRNHTFPLAIREIKSTSKPCEFSCGRDVVNQVVEYRRLARLPDMWLRKCASCGLYQHPETGEMVDHRLINKWFPSRNKQDIREPV